MIKVLFVCLGNICRSPLAQAVFMQKLKEADMVDHFHVDSCGTSGYHIGEEPDDRTIETCRQYSLQLQHRARQVTPLDLRTYDHILVMDRHNLEDVRQLAGKYGYDHRHVRLLREFDFNPDADYVPDPYYGNMSDFEQVYHILNRSCQGLLDHIMETHSIG